MLESVRRGACTLVAPSKLSRYGQIESAYVPGQMEHNKRGKAGARVCRSTKGDIREEVTAQGRTCSRNYMYSSYLHPCSLYSQYHPSVTYLHHCRGVVSHDLESRRPKQYEASRRLVVPPEIDRWISSMSLP